MKKLRPLILLLFLSLQILVAAPQNQQENWPSFRGPNGTGVAPSGQPPVTWDENTNIKWKIPIPGKGLSTPIIWGDQIFILTAISTDKLIEPETRKQIKKSVPLWMKAMGANIPDNELAFTILSISRKSGEVHWHKRLNTRVPFNGVHKTNTWASHSPITDGEYVYAYFGSYGLYCLDMQGNLIWEKNLGNMSTLQSFGEGSSPALFQDKLVINWDHEGDSFITCLDKNTGQEIWRQQRIESTSWSTPLIINHDGIAQVIVSATPKTRSHNLNTGEIIWEAAGMTKSVVPTPIYKDGFVYVASGFGGNAIQAIDLSLASGDITATKAIKWQVDKNAPYTPSHMIYGNQMYYLKFNNGKLSSLNIETGNLFFGPEKLKGMKDIFASLTGADNKIFISDRKGTTTVIEHGTEFKILSVNKLDDGFSASPVIAGKDLYLRGFSNLYCISQN